MRRFIVGVMGSGENADEGAIANAHELGRLIAQEGWIILIYRYHHNYGYA